VDPVPDPLLLRKSGSAGNRTQDLWICSQKLYEIKDEIDRIYSTQDKNGDVRKIMDRKA
jgi:hypothetical protein